MARDEHDVHDGVARLAKLAKKLSDASPGASAEMRFPLFGDTLYVQAEYLGHDEVFIAVGNNRLGALVAKRVEGATHTEEMVASIVAEAVHTYLRRVMGHLRRVPPSVEVEGADEEPTPDASGE